MTTKMKWKISRRLGIFLTINPKPTCHLQLHPASFWLHSQVLGMSILGIQVVPWSHQVPPPSPTKLLIFSGKLSLRAAKPQDAGHQKVCWMVSPRRMKTTNCTFKNLGGPNHRKPNLRHETQMNQRNLRFRPWEFYGWSPSVHPKGQ